MLRRKMTGNSCARRNRIAIGSLCLVGSAAFIGATPAQADIIFFTDQAAFDAALADAGKVSKGFEDFPWLAPPNSVSGGGIVVLDTNSDIPGFVTPGTLIDNLTWQSNSGGEDSSQVTPDASDIALFTAPFAGLPFNGLLANLPDHSFDILSGPPAGDSHTALGMTPFAIFGAFTTVRVNVYDLLNNLVGSINNVPAPLDGSGFLGILATGETTIGRVNLWDGSAVDGFQGIYNITAYVPIPTPGALALLGVAGLVSRRRRRR